MIIPRFINLGFPGFVARRWIWFHRVSNNSLFFFKQNIPSITRLEIWPKSLVWDKTDQFQNSVRVIESKLKRYLLDKTQELLNNWSDFDFVLIQPKERVIKFILPLDWGYKGFGASFLISPRHAKLSQSNSVCSPSSTLLLTNPVKGLFDGAVVSSNAPTVRQISREISSYPNP